MNKDNTTENHNVADIGFERELRQRLQQDATQFDGGLDQQTKADLFAKIDAEPVYAEHIETTVTRISFWRLASYAAVVVVVAFSWSMTQKQVIEPESFENYEPVVAAYQPIQPREPLIESQILNNEYAAILSDIDKLRSRIKVN